MTEQEIKLPDIGDFDAVEVIEVLVKPGERVTAEQSLLVLESDKATMEIPSPFAGVVRKLLVAVGDSVREGTPIAIVEVADSRQTVAPIELAATEAEPHAVDVPDPAPAAPSAADLAPYTVDAPQPDAHAGPSVRRLARELGVDLALVPGRGPKGRIIEADLQGYVKALVAQGGAAAAVPIAGIHVAAPADVDFAKFGPIESEPLNRVRRIAAANLHRSWVSVPHVTQFEDADVTELETFRQDHRAEAEARGTKLTFLPFLVKAVVKALQEFPHFNASLDRGGENLIVKRYYHIGVAVDTEHGLVVPVVRDADRKSLFELAAELQELSEKARARRLRPEQLQGGSFSISSLGGIGGTRFTPIVNHPEVAILGVSRMAWKPVWQDGAFVPRRMLPLSLSYDHRVIDGAAGARFTGRLAALLADLRRMLL